MLHRGYDKALPLQDKDSRLHGNGSMFRRSVVTVSVKLGIVWLILFQDVVNSRKQHSGNGDNCFFVTSAFFDGKIAITDFRVAFTTNRSKSALNKQRLKISSGMADTSSFLLPGTFIVLRRKTSPRATML